MDIQRWGVRAKGRCTTVARGDLVWSVSNAKNLAGDFDAQVRETLDILDASLAEAGSSRERLLSVQVILADIGTRDRFNEAWCRWVGDDPSHWPQRAVYGADLAPGLLIEVIATAARS